MVGLLGPGRMAGQMNPPARRPDESRFANRGGTGNEMYPADLPGAETGVGDQAMERQPPPGGEEMPNVTPEEQAQYNRFVGNGMEILFDKRHEAVRNSILNRIAGSPNPVEGLAATTVSVVTRLQQSAERRGVKLSPDVLMHGGMEIMQNIAELAGAAGIHDFSDDEVEQATYAALDRFGDQEMQRGAVDRDAVKRDFEAMIAADRAGRIEEVLPGITAKAKSIRSRGQEGT